MRSRPTTFAIVAALAAVVFALAAVGPGGQDPGRAGPTASGSSLGPAPAAGSLDAAIAALEDRVDRVPRDWQAAAALGIAYVQRARVTADAAWYPPAQEVLTRSLRLRPHGNPDALVGLGALAAARHDFRAALRWGRRAVREAPFDADAHGLLGDARLELGSYADAFRSFQTMVDTRPDLASYARVSYARELRGDARGAVAAMRAAYAVAGSRADAAWAAAHVGELHLAVGRLSAGETWLARARAADPSSIDAQVGLAWLAWTSGDPAGAIERYERVVARVPAPEHLAVLGDLYALTGRPDEAEERYELVRAEARLFRAAGVNTDLEIALFEADQAVSGDDPASARGALLPPRAEWSRRRSVHVADALAWALFANGRYRRAAAAADSALRLGTRTPLFLFHAGMIRLRLGEEARAERLLREAFAINPSFSVRWAPVLRQAVERLERT